MDINHNSSEISACTSPSKDVASDRPVRSLFKWAGGKTRLSTAIAPIIQALLRMTSGKYIEPFIGGASIPPLLHFRQGIGGDTNVSLISFYRWLARDHEKLFRAIEHHSNRMTKLYYYALRAKYRPNLESFENAAIFYALNRYSFNGIYRTNKNGDFNVPYNFKKRTRLPSLNDFVYHAKALTKMHFRAVDYRVLLQEAKTGDIVYLDPPYPATSETAFFNHYSSERFSHRELAQECARLDSIGCLWVMSNAATPGIQRLFRQYRKHKLNQTRFVSCKKIKLVARELLIFGSKTKNFGIEETFQTVGVDTRASAFQIA